MAKEKSPLRGILRGAENRRVVRQRLLAWLNRVTGQVRHRLWLKRKPPVKVVLLGAENRGRTDTMFPPRDFKSLASAYSAIPARLLF